VQVLGEKFGDQRAFQLTGGALADAAIGDQDAQAAIDDENKLPDRADQLAHRVRLQRRPQSGVGLRRGATEWKFDCFRSVQTRCSLQAASSQRGPPRRRCTADTVVWTVVIAWCWSRRVGDISHSPNVARGARVFPRTVPRVSP
jgi:hypothetical protein